MEADDVQRTVMQGSDPRSHESAARVGSRVMYLDRAEDEVEQVVIVPHAEADFANDHISSESPLARALIGHLTGDLIRAATPGGIRRLTIIAVEPVN